MKNKYLLIVFVVLLAIYAGVSLFGDKKESSFNDKIADFDIESIDLIKIHPKDISKKEFSLQKENDKWMIKTDDNSYAADQAIVENALTGINKMKIKNIITKNPDKFGKYELEDGKCKQIRVFSGKKKLINLLIGKFKFDQQTNTASSYVRLAGKNEVYSTDGFSSINISDNISTYRIKDLADFNTQDVKSIKYIHNNISTELIKQGDDWVLGNIVIDSLKISNYLSSMSDVKGTKFLNINDNWHKPVASDSLIFTLSDGDINIVAYPDTIISKGFVIHGSANEKAYFESDSTGLYKRIFGKLNEIIK